LDNRDLYCKAVLLRAQLAYLINSDGLEPERDPKIKVLQDQIDELQARIWLNELSKDREKVK